MIWWRRTPRSAAAMDLERGIATVWANVLGVDRVGVEDSFVELGGNSVTAMRVVAEVEELIGIEVSLRSLLETGTVAGMAQSIRTSGEYVGPA